MGILIFNLEIKGGEFKMEFEVYGRNFETVKLVVGKQKFPCKNIADDCMPCLWVGTPVSDYEKGVICVSSDYWIDADRITSPRTLSWVYDLCGGKKKIRKMLNEIYEENKDNEPHHIPPYNSGKK